MKTCGEVGWSRGTPGMPESAADTGNHGAPQAPDAGSSPALSGALKEKPRDPAKPLCKAGCGRAIRTHYAFDTCTRCRERVLAAQRRHAGSL